MIDAYEYTREVYHFDVRVQRKKNIASREKKARRTMRAERAKLSFLLLRLVVNFPREKMHDACVICGAAFKVYPFWA